MMRFIPPRDLPAHVPALNGIRGLAVLAVICSHFTVLFGYQRISSMSWLNRSMAGGFLGVDVFFVLSGFLITSLLLKEHARNGRIRIAHFYARRALRLLPALYFVLVVDFVIAFFENASLAEQWNITWCSVLYLNNWYVFWPALRQGPANFPAKLGHLWSLSVEEQFYLIWPVLVYIVMKFRKSDIWLSATVVLLVIAVIIRRHTLFDGGSLNLGVLLRTDARIDSLFIGALLALFYRHVHVDSKLLRWGTCMCTPVFFLIAYQGSASTFLYGFGFTLVAIMAAIMILSATEQAWGPNSFLEHASLTFIGKISYGLYLWHFVVFTFLGKHLRLEPHILKIFAGLAISLCTAVVSWHLIEKPFLRIKNRKFAD